METSPAQQEQDLSEYKGPEGVVKRWLKELDTVRNSKEQRAFEKSGEKIVKQYRNQNLDRGEDSATRVMFNILWSNVQVLKPSLYSRMPKVVVERRFKDADPIGRLACQIAERATSFMLQTQQDRFNYAIKAAVEDRLLPGCGQVWLRYVAEFDEGDSQVADGPELGEGQEEGAPAPAEPTIKPNSERVIVDPLNWLDYFHSLARNPFEIRWQARRVYMTRAQLIERFGDIGKAVKLGSNTDGRSSKKLTQEEREFLQQAEVFEIWDEESKSRIWISPGYVDGPLDTKPGLNLNGFFPCPIPLLATTTTDSMYPTADYKIYERLADEIDYVTKRVSSMVECIRVVGMVAASLNAEIKNMLKLDDGQLWPVENWAQFMGEKGGLASAVNWFPFEQAVNAIEPLMQYRDDLIQKVNQITGIPDIAQGMTDPNETAEAQQRKSKWAVVKLQEKQADVQRFCREIIAKMAEIIFEPGLFLDETIALMCGVAQMPPEDQQNYGAALALLRDDRLRTFRVDIETDSTIAIDEEVDQDARMKYMAAVSQMIQGIESAQQFRPEAVHPMIETALFAVRGFRTGKPLEGAWERALQQIEDNDAAAAANPQPPPPDPALLKVQNEAQKAQMDAERAQNQLMLDQQKFKFEQQKFAEDQQRQVQKDQADYQIKMQQTEIAGLKVQNQGQIDATALALEKFKEDFKQMADAQLLELEKFKTISNAKQQIIEQTRADREEHLHTLKTVSEHVNALTSHVQAHTERLDTLHSHIEAKAKSPASSTPGTQTAEGLPSQIHLHIGGGTKQIKMARDASGNLTGTAVDVPSGEA